MQLFPENFNKKVKLWWSQKVPLGKLNDYLRSKVLVKDGNKDVIEINLKTKLVFGILSLFVIGLVFWANSKKEKTSYDIKTEKPLLDEKDFSQKVATGILNTLENLPLVGEKVREHRQEKGTIPSAVPLSALSAPQVIERNDGPISRGSQDMMAIGKLTTSFDSSREGAQRLRVLIPYGVKGEKSGTILPMTVVEGESTIGGKDKRVLITFDKAFLPDGRVLEIQAEALSSGDFSKGVKGEFHSEGDVRVASGLGMTLLAGVTGGLADKVALADGTISAVGGLKNALLQGISETAKIEGERQMEDLGEMEGYVTLDSGQDLIVSFINIQKEKNSE